VAENKPIGATRLRALGRLPRKIPKSAPKKVSREKENVDQTDVTGRNGGRRASRVMGRRDIPQQECLSKKSNEVRGADLGPQKKKLNGKYIGGMLHQTGWEGEDARDSSCT